MILLEDILHLHDLSIKIFGGGNGIRDIGLLESAIARPFQTFGSEDLYPSILEKAAALVKASSSTIHLLMVTNVQGFFIAGK
jgi:death on curing protein